MVVPVSAAIVYARNADFFEIAGLPEDVSETVASFIVFRPHLLPAPSWMHISEVIVMDMGCLRKFFKLSFANTRATVCEQRVVIIP